MRITLLTLLCLLLAACGKPLDSAQPTAEDGSNSPMVADNDLTDCDPDNLLFPNSPAEGESRDGLSCQILLPSPLNPDDRISFQVIEPPSVVGGETYPVILEGHGFGGSRQTNPNGAGVDGVSVAIGDLHNAGYGIISIDQAGHGDTDGLIKVMDPDQEGRFLIAILDWIDSNIDWAAQGPDADAGTDNILLGAVGPSYGGGYQLLIHAIDPKKRLDAIVPRITWHDLRYSLDPNLAIKGSWASALFAVGNQSGGGGNFDPFVSDTFTRGFQDNAIDQFGLDYFGYHGLNYFCNGQPVPTNGGPGTAPGFAPNAPTQVDALFFQGFRDVLFNFNEAFQNFDCLRGAGGDVRLFSFQSGHNTIPVVPDMNPSQGPDNSLDSNCGDIAVGAATVAWFDEHLKGQAGAADAILRGEQVCLSLTAGDAVFVDDVTRGTSGTEFAIPATNVIVGTEAQIAVPLMTVGAGGDVFGGIPRLQVSVTDTLDSGAEPFNTIIYAAVGHMLASNPGTWEIMDNQIVPLRGTGDFDIDLIGAAERLAEGDQIALLLYGLYNAQYATTGSRPQDPFAPTVTVEGRVFMPLLGSSARDVVAGG
ncbi:hypothetical protein GYB61_07560 [bacterium]|nr:hypothetical protein [bacterium]